MSMVRGSHRTEVGGPFDQFLHLLPGFLVSLLPFGILQSVADSHLVDVGDIGTENFILAAQFVHLYWSLPLLFCMQ